MRRRGVGRVGRPGLMGTAARTAVIAGTATAVSGRVAAGQQQKAMQAQEAHQAEPPPPPPPPPVAAAPEPVPAAGGITDDVVDQLKALGDLVASGILTEEEFAAKKAQLLGL